MSKNQICSFFSGGLRYQKLEVKGAEKPLLEVGARRSPGLLVCVLHNSHQHVWRFSMRVAGGGGILCWLQWNLFLCLYLYLYLYLCFYLCACLCLYLLSLLAAVEPIALFEAARARAYLLPLSSREECLRPLAGC